MIVRKLTVAEKVKRKHRGLLEYLEFRLGKAIGHGEERHFYCPFCIDRIGSESSKRKLDVNVVRLKVSCYRCEYKAGNLERLFRDLNGGTLKLEEARIIKGEITPPSKDFAKTVRLMLSGPVRIDAERKRAESLPKEFKLLTEVKDHRLAKLAVSYLTRRGCEPELWDRFKIGYCWDGRYACRLVFPVYQGGQVVYFTTRYCDLPNMPPNPVKSLNPEYREGFVTKEDILLNFDGCLGAKIVAVTEGPFSCMAFPHAVAGFGKHLSDRQIELIEELAHKGTEEIVIALDPDAVSKIDALRARLTGRVPKVSVLKLGHGDPWDRRADLDALMAERGEMSFTDRVKGRFKRGK